MARGLVVTVLAVDVAMAMVGGWLMRKAAAEPLVVVWPRSPSGAAVASAPEDDTSTIPRAPAAPEHERVRRRSDPHTAAETAEAVVVAPPPDAAPAPPPAPADASPPDAAAPEPPPAPGDVEDVVAEAVRRHIEAHRESILQCYQRAAKSSTPEDPLAGRVEVHLTVLPSGDVANVRVVSNETGSEPLGACLVGVISGWRVPGPAHDALDYVWPFLFSGAEPR